MWTIKKVEKLPSRVGDRAVFDKVYYIASLNLNERQQERLLNVCVSLSGEKITYEHEDGSIKSFTAFAIGLNRSDEKEIEEVLERESIQVIRED
jgi:hypothetical protein